MVQFKNSIRGLTPFAFGALALYSCDQEDEASVSNNDLLIGEWKVVSVDGKSAVYDEGEYIYSFGFKFEADGDFGYCYDYQYESDPSKNFSECEIEGEWEWINQEQTQLLISDVVDGTQTNTYIFDIDVLTEDRLEGDYYEQDEENENYRIVLEKYDF